MSRTIVRSGGEIAEDRPVKRDDAVLAQALAQTLIHHARIGEAVAHDPVPDIERWNDRRLEVLIACGVVQECLAQRLPAINRTGDEQSANLFGSRGAARLARHEHAYPALAQMRTQKRALRGLAGAPHRPQA